MALRIVGSLWEKHGQNENYFSGTINEDLPKGTSILIFKTKEGDKKGERSPDAKIKVRVEEKNGQEV
jgi:hypothetical protein